MKTPTLPQLAGLVRDVMVPAAGIVIIVIQVYQPGERWALVVAGLTMMGFPVVAAGARKLDEAAKANESKPDA